MEPTGSPGPSPDRGRRPGKGKPPRKAPAGPPGAIADQWGAVCIVPPRGGRKEPYRGFLRRISTALLKAQKEIRVLKALNWPDSVGHRFLARKGLELPRVEYPPLDFDAKRKAAEFRDIESLLDPGDPLQGILRDTAAQYRQVLGMLEDRGTKGFYQASCSLYGHPLEPFTGQTTRNIDLARHLDRILGNGGHLDPPRGRMLSAEETVVLLKRRLGRVFRGTEVRVEVSHQLTADAAAGANRIRIKKGRMFSRETVNYLEQHEGYVHMATTLNGARQHVLPILSKASPRAVRVNEGLAVFAEWASHTMTVHRMRRLVDRVLAIRMAEEGADFREVWRSYVERGEPEPAAFDIARRVFRGGDLRGRFPFTKDASYLGDFLRIYNFSRVAAKRRRIDLIALLFAGKVTLMDIPVLSRHALSGEVRRARYLPPWMKNPDWLTAHMAVSSFLDGIRLRGTEEFYEQLFAQCAPPAG